MLPFTWDECWAFSNVWSYVQTLLEQQKKSKITNLMEMWRELQTCQEDSAVHSAAAAAVKTPLLHTFFSQTKTLWSKSYEIFTIKLDFILTQKCHLKFITVELWHRTVSLCLLSGSVVFYIWSCFLVLGFKKKKVSLTKKYLLKLSWK